MLSIVTGNPKKYLPFSDILRRLQLTVTMPDFEIPEIQHQDFIEVVSEKAREARRLYGAPCLVDDAGLLLDAYPGFPGPITKAVCQSLGSAGFERLLTGTTRRARLQCHLACAIDGKLFHWQGEVPGTVDPSRPTVPGAGVLSGWFVPDDDSLSVLAHRRRALEAVESDIDELRNLLGQDSDIGTSKQPSCVFCAELSGDARSVFKQLAGHEIASRIVHRTRYHTVLPPLGQFVEGGLLILANDHQLSFAHLPEERFEDLELVTDDVVKKITKVYGRSPVIFEHGPMCSAEKGTCCVDHAHLNVFPVKVDVHARLKHFPHRSAANFQQLTELGQRQRPYLFVQGNDGRRRVYEVDTVPSQYIRKIITAEIGCPERWHWREYLGLEEMKKTLAALSDWNSL